MILCDVNVLLYSARCDSANHEDYRQWLTGIAGSNASFGISEFVFSSFLRIITRVGVYQIPSTLDEALSFITSLRERPNCVVISPGPRHWDIFVELCRKANARGNLVPDAYPAALAIESGSEWITTDRDYARFPGLRWRHPFE